MGTEIEVNKDRFHVATTESSGIVCDVRIRQYRVAPDGMTSKSHPAGGAKVTAGVATPSRSPPVKMR